MSTAQSMRPDPFAFLPAGSEMAERIRAFDWSSTPLGPAEEWSVALRTTLRIVLANRFPQLLWWGPNFIQLYNDAYIPIPGTKHPDKALGLPANECWTEIWHVIGPLIDRPFNGGPPTWDEDLLLEIRRHGFTEEAHFTIAYSPIPDETAPGGIGGVLGTIHEITEKVIGERRTVVLRDLATRTGEARTEQEACTIAAQVLSAHKKDIPFVLLYLIDPDRRRARLAGAAGVAQGEAVSPAVIELDGAGEKDWPLGLTFRARIPRLVEHLALRFSAVPRGPWSDPPDSAVVVPIASNRPYEFAGLMVAGISARLKFDEFYRDFLDLVKTQIATALAHARSYEDERKRAEALSELDRAKTAFFSNVSHEFRTPLTLMLGPIEDLLHETDSELTPATKAQLEVVNRNGMRLLRLVNTLLDFSRIEAGRVRALYQPTDLASFTEDLASVFRAAIERAGLRLMVDCPAIPEMVYVDHDMWEKIVLNLLSNAFKFTFAGQIKVALRAADRVIKLEVADTGIGIPPEEMPHLFERFHRVQNARGRTHEGSGIGLALVHELVRLHGGSITAISVVGEGTTFTINIPMDTAHLPPDQIGSESRLNSIAAMAAPYIEEAIRWLPDGTSNDDGNRETPPYSVILPEYPETLASGALSPTDGEVTRVLVADDNSDMRQYVGRLLGERHQIKSAPDGLAALAIAREWRPNVVLTDVMMPKLDGFGLLREVRADPELREIPVIMLSARAGEESHVEGMDAGADDYLVKPFSARELIARVDAHLKMARMRREAAERAQYRTAQFEMVVNSTPVGIYLIDSNFRILLANPVARPVFGQIVDLIGRDLTEIVHIMWQKEYADEIVWRFRRCLETGESYETTERAEYRKDRQIREFYEWRIDRTLLPDGRYGVVCFFRDISAQVRARQELEQSREALRDDARRKSEFLATLAHELRNPLAPIANSIELLKRSQSGDSLTRQAQEVIDRQLHHMVRLVDDLLDISRITRDKLELRFERVTLNSVVDQSIEGCRPLFEERGHQLKVSLPAETIYLDADPVRLVQVFQNLLNNACKYTDSPGVVWTRVWREGDAAVVSVRDTGIGISPERLPDVFQMFSQVHSRVSQDRGGLGIGLALVKRLVEMHGGTVEAHSEGLGKGSEFVVRLPLVPIDYHDIDELEAERRLPQRHYENAAHRILVVDDNVDSAETMTELLELNGNVVEKAHDGMAALEAVMRFDPDVVLLDIGLPKMDGYQVCREIRRRRLNRSPILVALTGWGQDGDRNRTKEAGFDYHLVKPVSFEALLELLAKPNSSDEVLSS